MKSLRSLPAPRVRRSKRGSPSAERAPIQNITSEAEFARKYRRRARGFALTLLISVATSMFTAIFVTHKLLDVFADLGVKNQKLYVR